MGEHLLCKQGVVGSNPISSTRGRAHGGQRRQKAEDRKHWRAARALMVLSPVLWGSAETVQAVCSLKIWKRSACVGLFNLGARAWVVIA